MSLRDLLYRCAYCGAATHSDSETVHCEGCGRRYGQSAGRGSIEVTDPQGAARTASYRELADRIAAVSEDSRTLTARAAARFSGAEHPVRYQEELIGFFEEWGGELPGHLVLEEARLRFEPDQGAGREWALRDVRAVQTASGAIQISPPEGGVVSFRMLRDSPRRWELALKDRIRRVWRAEDRGEIVEFQPRIRSG